MNAIILAGGKGSRLVPWHAPKCLLPVNGVSILERLLQHLLLNGYVDKAVVCTGYRAEDVKASIAAHDWTEDSVVISDCGEEAPMGTRLMFARRKFKLFDGPVLVCYGDELADVNVKQLLALHGAFESTAITFAASYTKFPGGEIESENEGHAVRIIDDAGRYINIGFAVIEPECWAHLKPEDGLSTWINRVSSLSRVRIYYHEGRRATVNALADLENAEKVWR